jgi:23S rRNA (adenine2503-C2)-methyltransferase
MLPARLYEGIQRDRARSIGDVGGVSSAKLEAASAAFSDESLELVSVHRSWDLSARYAFRLRDGAIVESVLLHHHGLWTVCVSSQAGCPLACAFCATGQLGLKRDLEAWEIVDQVLQVGRDRGVRISDIVFMGMGEPLLNEAAVYQAAAILHESHGCQISAKRIVISTSGVVPAIHRFIDARRPFRLVFSLASADPAKRAALMPIQQRFGFDEFLDAVRRYERHRGGKHVTLEYVAIRNFTMGDDDVEAIRTNLTGFRFILNVIPLNPIGNHLESPTMAEVRAWTQKLRPLGMPVKVRYSGGKDQLAGCGQLGRSLLQTV